MSFVRPCDHGLIGIGQLGLEIGTSEVFPAEAVALIIVAVGLHGLVKPSKTYLLDLNATTYTFTMVQRIRNKEGHRSTTPSLITQKERMPHLVIFLPLILCAAIPVVVLEKKLQVLLCGSFV